MGSYILTVGVLKYFLFLGVLSALSFILWCFCPMALLSIFAFLCLKNVIAWRECWLSTPVSCDHGIVHLDCWSIKIFSLFGRFVHFEFYTLGFCPMALLSIFAFLCPPTWSHDENVDCPPLYHVITGSYTLIVGVLKHFLFLMVLSALNFIVWGFCPMALLFIFAFFCPPTWSHDKNVDCKPMYHMIMGSYTLIVVVLNIFSFWGFCPLWVLSFGAFVLWRFCPFLLFSVSPRNRIMRMLIVHLCIMWSWDNTPWLLEY